MMVQSSSESGQQSLGMLVRPAYCETIPSHDCVLQVEVQFFPVPAFAHDSRSGGNTRQADMEARLKIYTLPSQAHAAPSQGLSLYLSPTLSRQASSMCLHCSRSSALFGSLMCSGCVDDSIQTQCMHTHIQQTPEFKARLECVYCQPHVSIFSFGCMGLWSTICNITLHIRS